MMSLDRRNSPATRRLWARSMDLLGRLATLAALAFIVYGFIVEGHRSAAIKTEATKAKVIAARVGKLGKQNEKLLDQIQAGRRISLTTVCRTNNETRAAARKILERFKVASEEGLAPIDCDALLVQASIP